MPSSGNTTVHTVNKSKKELEIKRKVINKQLYVFVYTHYIALNSTEV